mgnify:CR=1 FL=1|jgi:heptosyltransferase-1
MLKEIEKLLIIKPSSLGDIVHSLAFLNAVKEWSPMIKIHWVIAKGYEDLLIDHPLIEKVIVIDKDKWRNIKNLPQTLKDFSHLRKQLKTDNYPIAVDLQGLLRSGIIIALCGAKIKCGFKEGREFSRLFYNKIISAPMHLHAVLRYLEIAKMLGCPVTSIKFPLPPEKEPEWLKKYSNYVTIIPSSKWMSKNWPISYFIELIKMLPYNFIVVGSKEDKDIGEKIEECTNGKAKSVAGKTTLKELIAVFKKSLFVITPDTGTMHLAVACGKKVVAIFGPTSPERTGPFGNEHLVIKSNENCSPCFKKSCTDLRCMRNLTPEKIFNIIKWRIK